MEETIKDILIRRDGMSTDEAQNLILEAKLDLMRRLEEGETPDNICEEWFGLEPDYIFELIN
jgi:hypothetical protein